ncbi:MAG: hypothetical protein AB7F35_12210 [Acetobacteraceae bacterium]
MKDHKNSKNPLNFKDRWTDGQRITAIKMYESSEPVYSVMEIAQAVNRSPAAVRTFLQRSGKVWLRIKQWKTSDENRLRQIYPDDTITAAQIKKEFPGFTSDAIRARAKRLGLKRPKVLKSEKCQPLLEDLRNLIQDSGIAFSAVFEEAGLTRYCIQSWFSQGRSPRLCDIDAVLSEIGYRLTIVPDDGTSQVPEVTPVVARPTANALD